MTTDTSTEAVEKLAELYSYSRGRNGSIAVPFPQAAQTQATLRALAAERDELRHRAEAAEDKLEIRDALTDGAHRRARNAEAERDRARREALDPRPDVWASHMCRELMRAGYPVPYEQMVLAMQTVGGALIDQPATDKWRDLKSAPKDRTAVQVIDRDGAVSRAYYDPSFGGGRWLFCSQAGHPVGKALGLKGWMPLAKHDDMKALRDENERLREAFSGHQIWDKAEKVGDDEFVLWTPDGHVCVRLKITHRHPELDASGVEFLACDLLDLLNARAALAEGGEG